MFILRSTYPIRILSRLHNPNNLTSPHHSNPHIQRIHRSAHVMSSEMDMSQPLVWIDCEMTGLDVDNDVIIEIFCIITNGQMQILDEAGWGCVVHCPREKMDAMSDYVKQMHQRSGLTPKVLASTTTAEEAADGLLKYIQRFVPERKVGLLAGSSVHADKAFLRKEPYKKVNSWLHHRILDVSTIKEAAKRWSPREVAKGVPQGEGLHEAKADILESIAQARYYKDAIFGGREGK